MHIRFHIKSSPHVVNLFSSSVYFQVFPTSPLAAMASISFNSLFLTSSSSHGFAKATHHLVPSALFPCTSLPDLCSKISTGLPLSAPLSRNFSGLSTKGSRPAGVAYATAATEKSVHDFTVKVAALYTWWILLLVVACLFKTSLLFNCCFCY